MNKVLIIVLISFLLVSALGYTGYRFWVDSNKENDNNAIKLVPTLPKELSENYDVTVNSSRFFIKKANSDFTSFVLEYMWPTTRSGEVVVSEFACEDNDYKVFEKAKNNVEEKVTKVQFIDKIKKNELSKITLSAICEEPSCLVLIKSCVLNINN
jgi:hypothetical protein